MAEQRKEVFEYFDPNKAPAGAILIGATKVRRQNLTGPGQVQDVISIKPAYATEAESFKIFEQYESSYRKTLAQKLKSAGYYRGPIIGEATRDLREAYFNAQSELSAENSQRLMAFGQEGQQDLDNIETFLIRQAKSKKATGAGGGPSTTIQRKISTKLEAQTLIDEIYNDVLGRAPTQAEFDKYFKKLTKRQSDKPQLTLVDLLTLSQRLVDQTFSNISITRFQALMKQKPVRYLVSMMSSRRR